MNRISQLSVCVCGNINTDRYEHQQVHLLQIRFGDHRLCRCESYGEVAIGIEPYMQEDLSLNTKQYPILTISLIFSSPRQDQRIFTNFLDIHQPALFDFFKSF